jgi:hypothetical protein
VVQSDYGYLMRVNEKARVCLCPLYETNPSYITLVMIAWHTILKPVISIRNSFYVLDRILLDVLALPEK